MSEPHFGRTRHGLPVHRLAIDHLPVHSAYARLNKRVAVTVTAWVGSMSCAWLFCLLALASLPAVLTQAFHVRWFPGWLVAAGLIALVAWIAQTFLQLVLLSVIMVGQNVQQAASDARAAKTFEDVETVLDRLDTRTEGGITEILARVDGLDGKVVGLAQAVQVVMAARTGQPGWQPGNEAGFADILAEIRAIRALVTPTQPMPGTAQAGSAGTAGQQPQTGMGSRVPKRGGGRA